MDQWLSEQREQERAQDQFDEVVRGAEFEAGIGDWLDQQEPQSTEELASELNDNISQTGDDLAQAAQQLVSIVENDKSEKFQNSSFLEVMRKIASSQLVVRDNQLVESGDASSATAVGQDGSAAASADQGSPSHVTGRSQGPSNKVSLYT